MPNLVVMGAKLKCSFGTAPSSLIVIPKGFPTMIDEKPAATIIDNVPMTNIPPFGMCKSLTNPTVAAATSGAAGVLTPMPCVPVIPAPWVPGTPSFSIHKTSALNENCKCFCNWGGVIQITDPGQKIISVP